MSLIMLQIFRVKCEMCAPALMTLDLFIKGMKNVNQLQKAGRVPLVWSILSLQKFYVMTI